DRGRSLTADFSQPGASAGERAVSVHPEPGRPDPGTADAGGVRRLSVQGSQDDRRGTIADHGGRRVADVGRHFYDAAAVPEALSGDEPLVAHALLRAA